MKISLPSDQYVLLFTLSVRATVQLSRHFEDKVFPNYLCQNAQSSTGDFVKVRLRRFLMVTVNDFLHRTLHRKVQGAFISPLLISIRILRLPCPSAGRHIIEAMRRFPI